MVERQEKGPPFRERVATQRLSHLVENYFQMAKTTAPTIVRTALSSTEKSTERLISISLLRHNCPNTRRKQASDAVNRFIASLLCRATALVPRRAVPIFGSRITGADCGGLGLPTKRPNRDREDCTGMFAKACPLAIHSNINLINN